MTRYAQGMTPLEHVRLADHCTMGVGGPARYFVEAHDESAVLAAFEWARARRVPLHVLGGGSNLVVADEGVDGLVVKIALRGVDTREADGAVELTAAAGEPWDELVRKSVERGWAGLECLSGIPGLVGATPMQNVGAYGQEVSDTVSVVRALDTSTGRIVAFGNRECRFTYRDSLFRSGEPDRYVVLSVGYRLRPNGPATVRYVDVEKNLAAAELAAVEARAGDPAMPRWPLAEGRVKLSAAWLIEHAGFARGVTDGPIGLSTRHTLAVVAHDGARAQDVVAFARRLQAAVEKRFGVHLTPEPVFWGPIGGRALCGS